jgi:hypothetical protein
MVMPILLFFIAISAWITHVVYSISAEAWGFLIAGAFFPVAVVHGVMIWLGFGVF